MAGRFPPDERIFSIEEMGASDRAAIAAGVAGITLMEHAGRAVTDAILDRFERARAVVLCGPGNNGGDGFVVARRLGEAGWPVRLGLLGERTALKGDAARAAATFEGEVERAGVELLGEADLVVDALFGAGLARPLDGRAADLVGTLAERHIPVVAVDMPSGVHGDTGEILGAAAPAVLTVTFHRPKPGHFLLPGREVRGELVVADIGIPPKVDRTAGTSLHINGPARWQLPVKQPHQHKYSHGHVLVMGGGPASSGAGRLAARAALRGGAGAVTVLVSPESLAVHASQLTAVMVNVVEDDVALQRQLDDPRRNAVLLGPGGGIGDPLRHKVLMCLQARKACVLDADALTSFGKRPTELFEAIAGDCVMTPHEGEFGRLFKIAGNKLQRARTAARISGATILIKGADTVVADPAGRAVIQPEAPADLATAGSGDVLAGLTLGLLGRGMRSFDAAAAAVWLHADAARGFGPGLIAEDLPDRLPDALARAISS